MKIKTKNLLQKEKERLDTGFGSKETNNSIRMVKANGEFNVKKLGQSTEAKLNLFHRLITMPTWKLGLMIFTFYFLGNLFFASVYMIIGIENLIGIVKKDTLSDFWEAFFFSSQTLTTLGYGRIAPVGFITNVVASIEALVGLLAFSITTGLLYGRFSRPTPRIIYSKNALVAPYLDINALMIKIANENSNQLINVEVSIIFSRNEEKDGKITRQYHTLDLERKFVKYFALSWTLVHPMTENSPLWGETPESLENSNAEILISLDGTNDTFADSINSRYSYQAKEILFGYKFENIIETNEAEYVLDLRKIDEISKV